MIISVTDVQALLTWQNLETGWWMLHSAGEHLKGEALLFGATMLKDAPNRLAYMKTVRNAADSMLEACTRGASPWQTFKQVYQVRNDMRLAFQKKQVYYTRMLSRAITKDRNLMQTFLGAMDKMAENGLLAAKVGKDGSIKSAKRLLELTDDEFDRLCLYAINSAGGTRKGITPLKMSARGAGLVLFSVVLAAVDIYLAEDRDFAVTKNITTIAAGAGGTAAGAAIGLACGGPIGGIVGAIICGLLASVAAEEIHFCVRGLRAGPKVDRIMARCYSAFWFKHEEFAASLHVDLQNDIGQVYAAFRALKEKSNSDSDDAVYEYVRIAKAHVDKNPDGLLERCLKSPLGTALLDLMWDILDEGWTTSEEYVLMGWMKQMKAKGEAELKRAEVKAM